MSKVKITLAQANSLADRIMAELAPVCDRVEVAGSIRRKKSTIGDIEIVCIPKTETVCNLFGEAVETTRAAFDGKLQSLVDAGRFTKPTKNGEKFKQFGIPAVSGLHLDLFMATPENWGLIFAIRTGCAEFSQQLVTQRGKGGLLPDDYLVSGGSLWRGGQSIPTPSEQSVFDLIGGWLEPEDRTGRIANKALAPSC